MIRRAVHLHVVIQKHDFADMTVVGGLFGKGAGEVRSNQ